MPRSIFTKSYKSLDELPVLLNAEQVAQLFEITGNYVSKMCRTGEIPGARLIGRKWKIPKKSIIDMFGGMI